MLASGVLAQELTFHNNAVHLGAAKAATQGTVNVFDYDPPGRSNYYYDQAVAKNLVVLHHTAGWFWGDLDTLTQNNNHVSVAFVVARSGWIYRLFDPTRWSYHLGPGTVGDNEFNSKRAIAIEISNVGELQVAGNDVKFGNSKYCGTDENQYYATLPAPYRGYSAYAKFTDAQYTAVNELLTQLCGEFAIPRTFLPMNQRFNVFGSDAAARSYTGIASHVNFRPTGKTDIGPVFDWPRIGG